MDQPSRGLPQWDLDKLLDVAKVVRDNASVPLSRFRVGAAVLTKGGAIFEGCNTECLIPVLGVCAERNAINHALIHGYSDFLAVAVVSDLYAPLLPCGTCLQYMQEFARQKSRDILIIAEGRSGERVITSLDELFRGGFPPETSVKDIQESFRWSSD
ncbi:MAG: cytidine deaminase [Deltaproteobacteria bacterium]|nr:cytidine deaminase [Deltaproteobacteria bacterium]